MQDWLTMTAADLGREIDTGDIDAVALTQTYLDAIDASPLRDRIFTAVTLERAQSLVCAGRRWTACRSVGKICSTAPVPGQRPVPIF